MVPTDELRPIMPYPRCPHCGDMQILIDSTYAFYKGVITCGACKGRYEVSFGDRYMNDFLAPTGQRLLTDGRGTTLLSPPTPLGDPELLKDLPVPLVPKELYQDFSDAVAGLGTSPPRLVAVACRYTVQRALILKGIPDREPQEMVNIARQKQIISEMAFRQCSSAIFMGGKGGHPQQHWTEQVGPNDAKQAVLATRRIILELFNSAALGG